MNQKLFGRFFSQKGYLDFKIHVIVLRLKQLSQFFIKGTPQNIQKRVKREGSNRQPRLISNFDEYGMSVGK